MRLENKTLIVLIDDEDVDFAGKLERLRLAFIAMGFKGYYIKTTCYDTLEELGLDPLELNLIMYDHVKKTAATVEIEEIIPNTLRKQLYNLAVGLGKKQKVAVVNKYLNSKDCSYGQENGSEKVDL